jgi:hypothetical protein
VLTDGSETWTMTTDETNALKIFDRKVVRKMYGPVKEGECWRIRTNKEIKGILQSDDIVKSIEYL